MTTSLKDRRFFIESLKSEECQCERPKKRGFAFCYGCYQRLPQGMRRALYRPVGEGFEQAYEDACRYLNDL